MTLKDLYAIIDEKERACGIGADMTPHERMERMTRLYNETEGDLHLSDGYNCKVCRNKGLIAKIDKGGNECKVDCECKKTRLSLQRAKKSGLGNIISENTFDKFRDFEEWQKQLKRTALAFCKDPNARWFYIGGQVGCGKTHICTAIAAHFIKAGKRVLYMLWSEDAKRLKAVVNDESYQAKIQDYKNVDVLYIDDFLKVKAGENPTAADINLAFEIINHRMFDESKITIISSEKTLDELMEYDEATMSRIYKMSGTYKFSIAKDYRKNYRLCDKIQTEKTEGKRWN